MLVDAHDEEGCAIARSSADAPEIDGVVYVENGATLTMGEFAEVRIVAADEHDLYAETVSAKSPNRRLRRNHSHAAHNVLQTEASKNSG